MASVSDFVFASTFAPYPFKLPNATFHSTVVGVVSLDIP